MAGGLHRLCSTRIMPREARVPGKAWFSMMRNTRQKWLTWEQTFSLKVVSGDQKNPMDVEEEAEEEAVEAAIEEDDK
jgi:hypothetical protein